MGHNGTQKMTQVITNQGSPRRLLPMQQKNKKSPNAWPSGPCLLLEAGVPGGQFSSSVLGLGLIFWLRDFKRGLFIISCTLRTALLSGWIPILGTVYRGRILPADLFL